MWGIAKLKTREGNEKSLDVFFNKNYVLNKAGNDFPKGMKHKDMYLINI